MSVGSRASIFGAHLAAFLMVLISVCLIKVVFVDGIARLTRELGEDCVHGVFSYNQFH